MRSGDALVLVALLLLAGAPFAAPSVAQGNAPPVPAPSIRYEVRLPDPFAEEVHVVVDAEGLPSGPFEMVLAAASEPTMLRNATWVQGALTAQPVGGAVRVELRTPLQARAMGFALVHLDRAIPQPANLTLRAADAAVEYLAPEGWSAIGPGGLEGLAVFGRDLRTETREVGEGRVTLVWTSAAPPDDWGYLTLGVPHIAAQHADPPAHVLVIRAPADALREPVAASPAVAVSVDAGDAELAVALARMHQAYRVVEVVPASAAWLREGQERYHALTSLLAANVTTAEDAGAEIARARSVADPNVTLPQAAGGSVTARQKGLVVVRALDTAIRNASAGRVGLADLLVALERAPGSPRVDSAAIEEAAERVAGAPLDPFFEAYVYGTDWPETVPLARAADIFLRDLRAEPPRAAPGEQVIAAFDAVNRGTHAGAVENLVALDGEQVGSSRVELQVGERARIGTPVVAIVAGDHAIEVGQLRATFRVLAGPSLRLDRATTTPAEPAAGEPFTLLVYVANDGEAPATASLEVREDDLLLQRSTNATIEGGATRAITLPMRLDEAGLHALQVDLLSGAGGGVLSHEVHVEDDGVSERGSPGASLALSVALVAALALLVRGATRAARGRRRR